MLLPTVLGMKKESQLRLLSHHAVKQFNPESVTVQKRVTMNRLYMETRHFSITLLTELKDLKDGRYFLAALLSFRDKSHTLPAPRDKSDTNQFYTALHYYQCLVPSYEQSLSFQSVERNARDTPKITTRMTEGARQ